MDDGLAAAEAMPRTGILVALDISKRAIGLAASDRDRILATPKRTLKRHRFENDVAELRLFLAAQNAVGLVIGYPLNMDGSAGPAAQSRRDTAKRLQQSWPDLPVMLQDERLTTEAVADAFKTGRWPRPKTGGPVDHYASAIILEDAMRRIELAHRKLDEKPC